MAKIHNSELMNALRNGAKLQNSDLIPNDIAGPVIPTMEVNPKLLYDTSVIKNSSSTTTGTLSIYTTLSDRDFYLTFISASYNKNATCDIASGRVTVNVTVDGLTKEIIGFAILTLTAEKDSMTISLSNPIKIDRNTQITFTGTFTAGALSRTLCIGGYEVLNPNA